MSDVKPTIGLQQRRIRHIRTIDGRNIVWNSTHLPWSEPKDAMVSSHQGVGGIVESSMSSSTAPSQPSSLSPVLGPFQRSCSTSLSPRRCESVQMHRRTSSNPNDLSAVDPSAMKRSESTSSIRSTCSTAVKDSSLTKSAYRSKKQPIERGLLDCYLTLHFPGEEDVALYTTKVVPNTTNPCFGAFDLARWVNWYDGVQTQLVVRMWARHAQPDSASLARHSIVPHHDEPHSEAFKLFIEWTVDLNALVFIGKSLQDIQTPFPDNSLVFDLGDGYYTAADIASRAGIAARTNDSATVDEEHDHTSANAELTPPKTKRSYTYSHIVKLNTLKDCIFDTQRSAEEVQQAINAMLKNDEDRLQLVREHQRRKNTSNELRGKLRDIREEMKLERTRFQSIEENTTARRLALKRSQERLDSGVLYLEENDTVLEENTKMHQILLHKMEERKKELIADLFSIYPIEQSYDDTQQFRIRGISLPNSVFTGCDDDTIATALGFTAHLVSMLAYYLDIPMRYPITPMGSRATIRDPVTMIGGPSRDFPLYAKGVDRYRFEFGVFLLNKNIEQMMNAYGLIVIDLRHTLPNIHYFIQAVLTTSISSMSVLSISSYANCGVEPRSPPPPAAKDVPRKTACQHNGGHLTLQPTLHDLHPPSPRSTSSSPVLSSPTKFAVPFLGAPHTTAGSALFNAVTTSSCQSGQSWSSSTHGNDIQ